MQKNVHLLPLPLRGWVYIQNIAAAGRLPCTFWGMSLLHQSKRHQLFKGWSDTFNSTDLIQLLLLPPISSFSLVTASPHCTGVPILVLYSLPDLGFVPVYKWSTGMKSPCEASSCPVGHFHTWEKLFHLKPLQIYGHGKLIPWNKTLPLCNLIEGEFDY